jgi:hypothetical protein
MNSHDDEARILARIAAMDGFTAILALETWLATATGLKADPRALIKAFPSDIFGVDGATLAEWSEDDWIAASPLDRETSAEAARLLLAAAYRAPASSAEVAAAIDDPRDTKLKAGPTLRVGAFAIALMLVAATDVKVDVGPVKIHKLAIDAETIVALTKLVGVVREGLPIPRP